MTRTTTRGTLIALLAGTVAGGTASAQSSSEIVLAGQIRDFQSTHPDFGLPAGTGEEVTALVGYYLDAGNMAYDGSGEKLKQDALDASSRAIAPHLFAANPSQSGVYMVEKDGAVANAGVMDSYDPFVGYDPFTAEKLPPLDTVSSIPSITAPAMSVAKVGTIAYKNDEFTLLSSGEYWCDKWQLGNNGALVIDGDVVIRADLSFRVMNGSDIYLSPGSTLTIWGGGVISFENGTTANQYYYSGTPGTKGAVDVARGAETWEHGALTVNNYGTTTTMVENAARVIGSVVAPDAELEVTNDGQLYGAVTAAGTSVDNTSGIHIAGDFVWQSECWNAGDIQSATSVTDTGDIASPMSFATWFRDAPGVNQTDTYQLIMSDIGGGAYAFKSADWNPIDGEMYGNESQPGNRNFTVALQSIFLNSNCTNNFFEIATSMDAWVFVGDRMVIDLGGTTGTNRQRIDLDRLGLSSDRWYQLRVFIAHRTDAPQDLEITTTLPLTPPRDIAFRSEQRHD